MPRQRQPNGHRHGPFPQSRLYEEEGYVTASIAEARGLHRKKLKRHPFRKMFAARGRNS